MRKKTSTLIIALIGISTIVLAAQMNAPRVIAAEIPTPAAGVSYTWEVLASSGEVWWFNNSWGDEGHHAIEVGGNITYNLTGSHPNDASGSAISGDVWYGNISIYYANATLNWTNTNCSATEVGSNLALSVYSWQGSLIAPSNWSQNYLDMAAEPADRFLYRDLSGMIIIDYEYGGQVTHLEYNRTTSVLTYAKTSFLGSTTELQLSSLSSLPVATLAANASTQIQGFPVQFTDRSFAGIRPFTYSWNFGDGDFSTKENPTHLYGTAGDYTVNLTITDNAGNVSSQSIAITVEADSIPVAGYTVTGTPKVNTGLAFTSTSHGGNGGLTYSWDFGDGAPVSTLQTASHTYTRAGSFIVTLTVRDIDGDVDMYSQIVTVPEDVVPGADPALVVLAALAALGVMTTIVLRKVKRMH